MVSLAKLFNSCIQCGRYVEVALAGEVTKDAKKFACDLLFYEVCALLLTIGAVVSASFRLGEITAMLWIFSSLAYRCTLVAGAIRRGRRAKRRNRKIAEANQLRAAQACSDMEYEELIQEAQVDHRPAVPLHVGFTIKRTGEFSMLMMGEGVLQTIILPIIADHENTQVSAFILCALVLSFVQLINFRYLPYEPEEHATRKSILRALALIQVTAVYQASLIWVGVGLKTVLKSHYKLAKVFYSRFAWLYCGSLAMSILALIVMKGLNMGAEEMFYSHDEHGRKSFSFIQLGAWCLKTSAAIGIALLPLANLFGNALLGATLAILILFFVLVKFRVGVVVADEVQEAVYTKDGLLASIDNMLGILQNMRETVVEFDLEDLDEEKVEAFKAKFLEQVAKLDEAEKHEEDKALELVSAYLDQNREVTTAPTGLSRESVLKVSDSGPSQERS